MPAIEIINLRNCCVWLLLVFSAVHAHSQCPDFIFNQIPATPELTDSVMDRDFFDQRNHDEWIFLDSTLQSVKDKETDSLPGKVARKVNKLHKLDRYEVIYDDFDRVMASIIQFEMNNEYYSFDKLSDCSVRYIQNLKTINQVQMMLFALERATISDHTRSLVVKAKIRKALSLQMTLLANEQLAWYTYEKQNKVLVKGVVVESGNDLFRPIALAGQVGYNAKPNANFLQGNGDMDYTGSLLIEVATDYLKVNRKRSLKTYQRLMYGSDAFTPYFKDTSVFKTDTSFNPLDRPHGSFQYAGYGISGLSWNNHFRWDINFKFGKIGGNRANGLQTVLHQDISYSPRPQGWGAQIANEGRLGFSLEYRPEWMIGSLSTGNINQPNQSGFYFSVPVDLSLGTYMTYAGAGIAVSNRNFYDMNSNFVISRGSRANKYWYFGMSSILRYVVHNTMLEGYGLFKTTEDLNDAFTPASRYYLNRSQVSPWVLLTRLTVSRQFKNTLLYYRWSVTSPETRLGLISANPDKDTIDLSNRWHQWGTIGVVFSYK